MARFEDLEDAGYRIKYDDAGQVADIVDSRGNSAGFVLATKTLTGGIVKTLWVGTQVEYDAITTKDANTEYNIVAA